MAEYSSSAVSARSAASCCANSAGSPIVGSTPWSNRACSRLRWYSRVSIALRAIASSCGISNGDHAGGVEARRMGWPAASNSNTFAPPAPLVSTREPKPLRLALLSGDRRPMGAIIGGVDNTTRSRAPSCHAVGRCGSGVSTFAKPTKFCIQVSLGN